MTVLDRKVVTRLRTFEHVPCVTCEGEPKAVPADTPCWALQLMLVVLLDSVYVIHSYQGPNMKRDG